MRAAAFLFCLGILTSGCATFSNQYASVYNEAVAADKSKIIIKDGPSDAIHAEVTACLKTLGYEGVLYSSPTQGFLVIAKEISLAKAMLLGDAHPCKIILKYTKAGDSKTRIDLVNGTTNLLFKKEVDRDLQKLAGLLQG